MKTFTAILVTSFAVAALGCAGLKPAGGGSGSGDAALFESLKKLAGRWESADSDKDGKPDATTVYRVTAGETTVEETLFPGQPHEMVDLYLLDQGKLVVTHYCMLGNQPRMTAARESTPQKLVFHVVDGMNLDPARDRHMGALTLTLVDSDHLQQEWVTYSDGKPGDTKTFDFTRK